jgi:L-seryl-tRNA(Ser) seleniumtransferase
MDEGQPQVSGNEAAFGDGVSELGAAIGRRPVADKVANRLRALPQVQRLLEHPEAVRLARASSRAAVAAAFRSVLDAVRAELRASNVETPTVADLVDRAEALIVADSLPGLRRLINATGVIIHTNLGRAPLAAEAVAAAAGAAQGYCNLEFDLETGGRGARAQAVEPLLCDLTGAEAAMVVNNAAAAVLLGLTALAGGGEVIVSRGELVEIGGGFRIPDVIRQGGARLVEVGTTNKTRIEDYAAAITPDTCVLLKVHQSNYRIIGFTEEAPLEALADLARARNLVLMHDLGGGALLNPLGGGAQGTGPIREPTVQDCLRAGSDIVAFSGDKLMGGPQAGLLVGTAPAIAPLRRHPLMRALRLDKMRLAALEATLRLYRDPETAIQRIPALRMLAQTDAALSARAQRLAQLLDGATEVEVEASHGYAGGGALPEQRLASWAVTLSHDDFGPDAFAAQLRAGRPGVVGRVSGGRLILDMLTVGDEEVIELAAAVRAALV